MAAVCVGMTKGASFVSESRQDSRGDHSPQYTIVGIHFPETIQYILNHLFLRNL